MEPKTLQVREAFLVQKWLKFWKMSWEGGHSFIQKIISQISLHIEAVITCETVTKRANAKVSPKNFNILFKGFFETFPEIHPFWYSEASLSMG